MSKGWGGAVPIWPFGPDGFFSEQGGEEVRGRAREGTRGTGEDLSYRPCLAGKLFKKQGREEVRGGRVGSEGGRMKGKGEEGHERGSEGGGWRDLTGPVGPGSFFKSRVVRR